MSTAHEHEVYGGVLQHGGKGNADQRPRCSVCGGLWGGHAVQREPVGWEAGSRKLGFSLGPSDAGEYELHVLSRTSHVELRGKLEAV